MIFLLFLLFGSGHLQDPTTTLAPSGNETAENTTMPVTDPPWPGYEDKCYCPGDGDEQWINDESLFKELFKLRHEADYDGPNPLVVYKAPVPREPGVPPLATLQRMFPTESNLDELDLQLLLAKVQITTTTTTTTTTPAPATEAGNDTDTTLAPEATRRRKREATSDEEMEEAVGSMLAEAARIKRAVPSDVVTEGVNKFIPRELMLGIKPLNASKNLVNATICNCTAAPGTRIRKKIVMTDVTWKPAFTKITGNTFKFEKGKWEDEINLILAGNLTLRTLGLAGATVLSAELLGKVELEEGSSRRKRATDAVQQNSIIGLDVDIMVAAAAADTNDSIPAVVDEAIQTYLTAKAEDSETTLADQMSAEPATNATCDIQDLVAAWNYSHLEQPTTENIGNYTIDPASIPSGLFAYYTCVDKG